MALARLALSTGIAARLALWRPGGWSRLLRFGGRHSLAVYLLHQPLLIGCVWLFSQVFPAPDVPREVRFQQSCEQTCGQTLDSAFLQALLCLHARNPVAGWRHRGRLCWRRQRHLRRQVAGFRDVLHGEHGGRIASGSEAMTEPRRPPSRFPWPPVIYLAAIVACIVPEHRLPLPWIGEPLSDMLVATGWVAPGGGRRIDVSAMRTLWRAKTTIMPHRVSDHLVTNGAFSFTRNRSISPTRFW